MVSRLKRRYVPRDVYVVEHGAEMFIYSKLSPIFRLYRDVCDDLNGQYREKKCRKALHDYGFWVNKEGWVRIRVVKQMDYLPKRGDRLYKDSLPEGYVRPKRWSEMSEEERKELKANRYEKSKD